MPDSTWVDQPVVDQMKRTYHYADGSYLTKEGGTVAWRNNNEGNLRPGSLSSNRIGVDKKNFAVFATPEDGHNAKKNLLFGSSSYKDLTLKQTINKYAPSSDGNDPTSYVNFIMKDANVENKAMSKYTADEQTRIMSAMKIKEGYKVGTETRGKDNSKQPTQNKSTAKTKQTNYSQLYNQSAAITYNKSVGYSNSTWKNIQNKLNDSIQSNLVPDGIPGKLTADAVYNYQQKKDLASKDGKCGPKTKESLGITSSSNNTKQNTNNTTAQKSGSKITIPSGSTIMSASYTPDLDLLNKHATQECFTPKNIDSSANYVAQWCTGGSSQHQCTRGTSLFLQLASYARGEADKKYKSSCAAHLFGSTNALTNYNISSSVANEYSIKSAQNKTGKDNMNTYISDNLTKSGDFVTFKYSNSQHIVFYSNGKWYSDFKQGTASGCGGNNTLYSQVHFFNR